MQQRLRDINGFFYRYIYSFQEMPDIGKEELKSPKRYGA